MHEKVDDKKGGEEGKGERKKNLLKNPKPRRQGNLFRRCVRSECGMKRPLVSSRSAADLYRPSASRGRSATVMGRRGGGGQSGDCTTSDVAAGVRRTDRRLSWHSGRLFVRAFLFKFTARPPARRLLSHFKVLIVFQLASGCCSAESEGRWLKRWRSV